MSPLLDVDGHLVIDLDPRLIAADESHPVNLKNSAIQRWSQRNVPIPHESMAWLVMLGRRDELGILLVFLQIVNMATKVVPPQ